MKKETKIALLIGVLSAGILTTYILIKNKKLKGMGLVDQNSKKSSLVLTR
jgi:uncharacterized protein (UPF0333 family)